MIEMINHYAPEHLIIATRFNDKLSKEIINAGSVFVGNLAAESIGDYASGTNHTLPTNGFARQYSGVNLSSFQKSITFQEIEENGLQKIGSSVEEMAEAEELFAHKNAVTIRLNDLIKMENKTIKDLVNPFVKSLKSYSSARDEFTASDEDYLFWMPMKIHFLLISIDIRIHITSL